MLVITRPVGKSVLIGENVEIKILDINDRGHVKLGIDAPLDVHILRKELVNTSKKKRGE